MATIASTKRQTAGLLSRGLDNPKRVVTFDVDFANDFTMGTATDVIQLGTLPAGTLVTAAAIRQKEAGTGSGTVFVSVGSDDVTGTLTASAAAGTVGAPVADHVPLVTAAATEVTLTGATAVRTTGKAQVMLEVSEAFPVTFPRSVDRDVLA